MNARMAFVMAVAASDGNALLGQGGERRADLVEADVQPAGDRKDRTDVLGEVLEGEDAAVDGLEQHVGHVRGVGRRPVVGVQDRGDRLR